MSGIIKLERAKTLLEKNFAKQISNLNFKPKLATISLSLRDGTQIYIRYNNHNQYSYSIIFSAIDLDRCRFDNYDDKWDVSTRPNHFHPRFNKIGFSSPMNGKPDNDLQLLYELIITKKLISKDFRFKK